MAKSINIAGATNLLTRCPNFDSCSVNNCPLYPGYTDEEDIEKKCPLSEAELQRVKARKPASIEKKAVRIQTKQTLESLAALKRKNGSVYSLTSEQSGKVNTLIKRECCNHDAGNCVMLDYGEGCKCPQIASLHICCTWFREAVLPLDKVLESSIFGNKDMKKRCAMCGKLFVPTNNRAKFCTKCIPKANRQRLQNHRAKNRTQNKNI